MNTIDREELKAKLDSGDDFQLVMTLNTWAFDATHIPGSLNITNPADAKQQLSPDDEIVVYCTNPTCVASITAYHALYAAGFKNTRRYAGGIEDWIEAGYPVEGAGST
ncbi:MAG: rhodanese-like domain-containing protein [Chloroflexi bacterium]|nr:rhodanese-like domain-containing protein [Chloroflexota bacterium]